MKTMSIPYEHAGRTRQKQRTRQALVDAARAIVAAGDHADGRGRRRGGRGVAHDGLPVLPQPARAGRRRASRDRGAVAASGRTHRTTFARGSTRSSTRSRAKIVDNELQQRDDVAALARADIGPRRVSCCSARVARSAGSRRRWRRCARSCPMRSCAASCSRSAARSGSRRWCGSPTSPGSHATTPRELMRWSAQAMLRRARRLAPSGTPG